MSFHKNKVCIDHMKKKISAFLKIFSAEVYSGNSPWPARVFLCMSVLLSYASVWPNEFVFDDKGLIVWNEFLKHWSSLPRLLTSQDYAGYNMPGGGYRPIQMLIYFLIYQAFGPSTVAFHALNIFLQALNACLLHHFGIRAGFKKGAAFAAALLWAVHPLHTSVVAYMASTAELLRGSFCLLGLITLLPDFTPRRIWRAMIFFMLALGCKESSVVFPALAAITFFFISKDRTRVTAYLKMWPLWLLAACYIAIWLLFLHITNNNMSPMHIQDYTSNFTNRALTSLATLPVYARLIVWPVDLHIERSFPIFSTLLAWQPMTGVLMAGLGFLQIFWGRTRRTLALSFGLLWFAIALSPYTGIVIPIDARINEGWLYLPTMGLFLGGAQTATGFFETRQNAARLLVMALAISLGIATFFQNEIWRNIETLYQSVLHREGRVDQLGAHLGLFYMEQGEFDKAIEQFQYGLDHADERSKIGRAYSHFRLALAWLHVRIDNKTLKVDDMIRILPSCQHIPEAVGELEKALQDNPDFYQAHQLLAFLYRYQGNNLMADFYQKQADAILRTRGGP